MNISKIIFPAAALSLLAALPFAGTGCEKVLGGNGSTANLPPVSTARAEQRTIEENIIVSGFVKPETATEIKSEINGRIVRINVENGDDVKAGDLLL